MVWSDDPLNRWSLQVDNSELVCYSGANYALLQSWYQLIRTSQTCLILKECTVPVPHLLCLPPVAIKAINPSRAVHCQTNLLSGRASRGLFWGPQNKTCNARNYIPILHDHTPLHLAKQSYIQDLAMSTHNGLYIPMGAECQHNAIMASESAGASVGSTEIPDLQ